LSSQYLDPAQQVIVVGRGSIDSTCEGNCTFTYDNATYPTVQTPASLTFSALNSYTLIGTSFVNGGVNPKVNVGGVWANITSASATSVTFIYPPLVQGSYPLNVYVNGVGYASPTIQSVTNLNVTGLSKPTGSRIGNTLDIVGNGLVPSTDPYFNFTIVKSGSKIPYQIVKDTPTALGISITGGSDGAVYTFTYTYKTAVFSFNYTTLNTSTPKVTLTGNSSVTYSPTQTLTFTRTNFVTTAPTSLSAYPVTTTGARFAPSINLTLGTISNTNVNFTVSAGLLGAGKWAFEIYYSQYGLAECLGRFEILAPTYTVPSVSSSYEGGKLLTVSGAGVSSLSTLDVGGFPAQLISSSSNTLVYAVPPYVTKGSQTAYGLTSVAPLTGTPFADVASNAGLAFDSLQSTYYSSSGATCYVGLDFGQYLKADVSRIRYFPLRDWRSAGTYLIGSTFKASVDNVTWDTLYTVDSTVHTGWNIWRPQSPLATYYRYVRFEHNSTSACKLA
jgi:hypothetical protein